jgi:hypothetical protein
MAKFSLDVPAGVLPTVIAALAAWATAQGQTTGTDAEKSGWAIRHFVGQRVRDYRQAQMQAQIELDSAALPAVAEQAGIAAETAIVIS